MSEIEAYLRKDWSDAVVLAYADLLDADTGARLRNAEGWLKAHPNNVALLVALGRLCIAGRLWGKAREYLDRALLIREDALVWEATAECLSGEGDHAGAEVAWRNALRATRHEATAPLPGAQPRRALDTKAVVVEERSEHGVPRLPGVAG